MEQLVCISYHSCCRQKLLKEEWFTLGHIVKVQSSVVEKSQHQEYEVAGHIVSTAKKRAYRKLEQATKPQGPPSMENVITNYLQPDVLFG